MCATIAGATVAIREKGHPFIRRTLCQAQFNLAVVVVQRLQVLVDVGGRAHQAKIKRAQHSNIPCAYNAADITQQKRATDE